MVFVFSFFTLNRNVSLFFVVVQAADGVAFLMCLYGAIINVITCGGICESVVVKQ